MQGFWRQSTQVSAHKSILLRKDLCPRATGKQNTTEIERPRKLCSKAPFRRRPEQGKLQGAA